MVTITLIFLAAICNAIMYVTQFKFYRSIFNDELFNVKWWNPEISWRNKYKDSNPSLGRNNKLVWFTDAFHFFKSSMIVLFALAIISYDIIIEWWIDLFIIGFTWNTTFSLFYKHLLKKQTYEQKEKR